MRAAATLTERDGEAVWTGIPRPACPPAATRSRAAARRCGCCTRRATDGLPPFTSGLVGYLSYDAVRRVERLPDSNLDDLDIPELAFLLASDLAVLDHHDGEVWLVANAINFDDSDERVDEAYADAVARVEAMTARLARPTPVVGRPAAFDEPAADPPAAHAGGVPGARSRRRWRRSRPARPSRSWSASGSRSTPPPTRSTSTGCCG